MASQHKVRAGTRVSAFWCPNPYHIPHCAVQLNKFSIPLAGKPAAAHAQSPTRRWSVISNRQYLPSHLKYALPSPCAPDPDHGGPDQRAAAVPAHLLRPLAGQQDGAGPRLGRAAAPHAHRGEGAGGGGQRGGGHCLLTEDGLMLVLVRQLRTGQSKRKPCRWWTQLGLDGVVAIWKAYLVRLRPATHRSSCICGRPLWYGCDV